MGRERTAGAGGDAASSQRHDPLGIQLRTDTSGLLSAPGRRVKDKHRKAAKELPEGQLDAKSSRQILRLAKEQQDEVEQEEQEQRTGQKGTAGAQQPAAAVPPAAGTSRRGRADSDGEQQDDEDDDEDEVYSDDEEFMGGEDGADFEELGIDENDQAILDSFMPSGSGAPPGSASGPFGFGGSRNLADIIMQKIQEREAGGGAAESDVPEISRSTGLDPKVVEVYTRVGQLLSRYKSGPLPKAFKILPTVSAWPTLLSITSPHNWTPHALLAATRIFASNLDPKQSQKFYRDILAERIREEIAVDKKLSVQSYMALKKALYKPAAFFKGLLFPLCESGSCTLREAVIIGSILSKVSIPVLHSGAALLKLADMDYSGPNSLFIRVLLDKKYALPYKVVDALVFHFLRFKRDRRELPVLWHQAFLTFIQRYKQDLTPEQKEALLEVLRAKVHTQITPEIRRELVNSTARGEQLEEPIADLEMELL